MGEAAVIMYGVGCIGAERIGQSATPRWKGSQCSGRRGPLNSPFLARAREVTHPLAKINMPLPVFRAFPPRPREWWRQPARRRADQVTQKLVTLAPSRLRYSGNKKPRRKVVFLECGTARWLSAGVLGMFKSWWDVLERSCGVCGRNRSWGEESKQGQGCVEV